MAATFDLELGLLRVGVLRVEIVAGVSTPAEIVEDVAVRSFLLPGCLTTAAAARFRIPLSAGQDKPDAAPPGTLAFEELAGINSKSNNDERSIGKSVSQFTGGRLARSPMA